MHRAVAAVCLLAWLSLGVQLLPLIGARGLLPVQPWLEALQGRGLGFAELPTWTWWASSDTALLAGVALGGVACLAALAGLAPRLCAALSGFLYLGLTLAARDFLSFQWDNLLIEASFLLALTPFDRQSALSTWLLRALVFKLYFLSGVAKWQSGIGDWQAGTAMLHYYQTAPIPTPGAWFAHHLPPLWHKLESWGTLALECALPFLIFGPRRGRLLTLAALTLFQLLNILTANYGFFAHLALALHLSLLDDADVAAAKAWLAERTPLSFKPLQAPAPSWRRGLHLALVGPLALGWLVLSTSASLERFADIHTLERARAAAQPYRVANVYHLFASVTTERIEPELQLRVDGEWSPARLRYKPGPPDRRPPFVAPHQPRLDFRLWFHGLSFRRGLPGYLQALLRQVCRDPEAAQPFFAAPLPPSPEAVRVTYWDYRYTAPGEEGWWRRELVDATRDIPCTRF